MHEVKLSSREYSSQDLKHHNMSTIAPLGMGASDTWRGAPDACLRGFYLPADSTSVGSDVPLMYGRSSVPKDSDESNGTSTAWEAKLQDVCSCSFY